MTNEYIIFATYGEYDDFNKIAMCICKSEIETELLVQALNDKEPPYYDDFAKMFEGMCGYIPNDLYFQFESVPVWSMS